MHFSDSWQLGILLLWFLDHLYASILSSWIQNLDDFSESQVLHGVDSQESEANCNHSYNIKR